MPRRRTTLHTVAMLALLACASTAHAVVTCTVSATSVAFGTYDPTSPTAKTSTGTVTVDCDTTPPSFVLFFTVNLSPGMSGAYATRKMFSGANALNYNLYTDAAFTQIWGDGNGGTDNWSRFLLIPPGNGRSDDHTVYGRIPALQGVANGSYADTIVVTVTY